MLKCTFNKKVTAKIATALDFLLGTYRTGNVQENWAKKCYKSPWVDKEQRTQ